MRGSYRLVIDKKGKGDKGDTDFEGYKSQWRIIIKKHSPKMKAYVPLCPYSHFTLFLCLVAIRIFKMVSNDLIPIEH